MLLVASAAIALYLISAANLLWRKPHLLSTATHLTINALALALHCIIVYDISYHKEGVNFSFFSTSNIISAFVVAMALAISAILPVIKVIAPLLFLAALNIFASIVWASDSNTVITPHVAIHVIASIAAYSVFSLATANACLIWFQNRALKTHQLNKLINDLPPLDILERALFQMLVVGFILLSVSILGGLVYIDDFLGQKLAHKTLFSILSWLVFAALLGGRFILGWRGNLAVKWTIGGFSLLMLGYFGSKFVLELILKTNLTP